jgi:hypothetical protein
MPEARAFVRNTADPRQVGQAGRRVKDRRTRELVDLRAVLATEPGRRMLWRFLGFCGVNETVLRENPIAMAEAAGRQNVGHYLMAEIAAADDEALFTMMREARDAVGRENRETDAVHTTRTEEIDDDADRS